MNFGEKRILGNTGLLASRLGVASSYRASAPAYEEAFERGCNYFTWGSFIRGRDRGLKTAVRNIVRRGDRDKLILSVITYTHSAWLSEVFLKPGLRALGVEYADILLLGYYPKRPPQRVLDGAAELKERGLVRFVGLTTHNRQIVPELAREGILDLFHIRYNVANCGAEEDVFPHLPTDNPPGIVAFTATRWSSLLKAKNMPPGESPLTAAECYRFALSHPAVDLCMIGPRNAEEMREDLTVLDSGPLSAEEMARVRRIGDHVYGKPRG